MDSLEPLQSINAGYWTAAKKSDNPPPNPIPHQQKS
jgi:hypothetical protein